MVRATGFDSTQPGTTQYHQIHDAERQMPLGVINRFLGCGIYALSPTINKK